MKGKKGSWTLLNPFVQACMHATKRLRNNILLEMKGEEEFA
jgi:hypothetical protein